MDNTEWFIPYDPLVNSIKEAYGVKRGKVIKYALKQPSRVDTESVSVAAFLNNVNNIIYSNYAALTLNSLRRFIVLKDF